MKTTFCTFVILALIWPMALLAQDAPSRPLRDPGLEIEPTPLPKSSASPVATPRPAMTPPKLDFSTPTPVPSPTPEASRPPTPIATPHETPAKIEETPAEATPPPASHKKRRRTVKREPDEQSEPTPPPAPRSRRELHAIATKLKEMEKQWEAQFNDPAVIEKSLAEDFVGTSPAGKIMTKKALLLEAKEDTSPPPKTITRDLDVFFHRPDLAVVTGAARQIARSRGGQIVEYNYRFTDTWVERDGEWRCVASQSMLVPR